MAMPAMTERRALAVCLVALVVVWAWVAVQVQREVPAVAWETGETLTEADWHARFNPTWEARLASCLSSRGSCSRRVLLCCPPSCEAYRAVVEDDTVVREEGW